MSQRSAKPLCTGTKGTNREVLREKLIPDHGLFSCYKGQQRAANVQDSSNGFSKIYRGF